MRAGFLDEIRKKGGFLSQYLIGMTFGIVLITEALYVKVV